MPALDTFLHFIIWNNELCLDKVTEHSELATLLFIFLAAFHLFCQRHGSSSFMMSKSLYTKLFYVYVNQGRFVLCLTYFGEKNRNDHEVLRWFRNAWRESHTRIPGYNNFLKSVTLSQNICYLWTIWFH